MNGPEHYRAAEGLVAGVNAMMAEFAADPRVDDLDQVTETFQAPLALAQVHATLALAAATALQPREFLTVEYRDQITAPWLEVAR